MKKILFVIALFVCMCSCTQNVRTRVYGGEMTIKLPPGQELMEATWKNSDLYYVY